MTIDFEMLSALDYCRLWNESEARRTFPRNLFRRTFKGYVLSIITNVNLPIICMCICKYTWVYMVLCKSLYTSLAQIYRFMNPNPYFPDHMTRLIEVACTPIICPTHTLIIIIIITWWIKKCATADIWKEYSACGYPEWKEFPRIKSAILSERVTCSCCLRGFRVCSLSSSD